MLGNSLIANIEISVRLQKTSQRWNFTSTDTKMILNEMNTDGRDGPMLILLDLSENFDKLKHNILNTRGVADVRLDLASWKLDMHDKHDLQLNCDFYINDLWLWFDVIHHRDSFSTNHVN